MKRRHALAAGLVLAASAVTGAAAEPLTGKALRDEAVSIAKVLRCPVSPNLTLYESESAIASELKGVIYEKLRAGETREQIFDFMVKRYGEQIRYEPDKNAGTAALWAAPWAAVAAGAVLVFLRMRKRRPAASRTDKNTD
ncbi:MAG: cytochrome c-type biogenesis protein CcmH [Sutterella sp.]|nr:cytochrome c-type biogenesis protein CcmH [Sutterella sp.]